MNKSKTVMLVLALVASFGAASARAESRLGAGELQQLGAYLDQLDGGLPADAATVDRLADMDFPGLALVSRRYLALPADVAPATERAYLTLLERFSRGAYLPWPLLQVYSPAFCAFMLPTTAADQAASQALCDRLLRSATPRVPVDLAVRLTPGASLERLAAGPLAAQAALLDAWVRRLSRGAELRPIAQLEALVQRVADHPLAAADAALLEDHLAFMAAWPALQSTYQRQQVALLDGADAAAVRAALQVQALHPVALDRNAALVQRFAAAPELVAAAIRNFAFDPAGAHAETLRGIWQGLTPEQPAARHACLLAMGVHPQGNAAAVLEALRRQPGEYLDVALPLLEADGEATALTALCAAVLAGERGHEAALRLATEKHLTGLESAALRLLANGPDLIVRLRAIEYLGHSTGETRLHLLPYLATRDTDIRLAAVMAFADRDGLSDADLEQVGPTLVQVALQDPEPGIRQEAIYTLSLWRTESTRPLLAKLRAEHAGASGLAAALPGEAYWAHRYWLVATLGLALLGDAPALADLERLGHVADPALRMEALQVYEVLGRVHPAAWELLGAAEPKLVATATHLIANVGDARDKRRLRGYFAARPLWREFARAGIDDHRILEYASADTPPEGPPHAHEH